MLCVCLWRWFRSTAAKLGTSFGKFKVMKDAQNHGKRIRLKRGPESILYLFQAAKKVSASNLSSGESFSASRALIEIWRSRKKNFPLSKFESPPLFTHMFPNFFHTVAVKIYCLWKTLSFDICRLPLFPIFVTACLLLIFAFMHLYR